MNIIVLDVYVVSRWLNSVRYIDRFQETHLKKQVEKNSSRKWKTF